MVFRDIIRNFTAHANFDYVRVHACADTYIHMRYGFLAHHHVIQRILYILWCVIFAGAKFRGSACQLIGRNLIFASPIAIAALFRSLFKFRCSYFHGGRPICEKRENLHHAKISIIL